jgi:hypothetical protein
MTFICCRCGAPFTPPKFEEAPGREDGCLFNLDREHLCPDCEVDDMRCSSGFSSGFDSIAACLEEHEFENNIRGFE